MQLADSVGWIAQHPDFKDLLTGFDGGQLWQSTAIEARPAFAAAAWRLEPRRILVATATYDRALQWQARLNLCGVPKEATAILPSGQSALFEDASPETSALSDRIGALKKLVSGEPCFILAPAASALERTLPEEVLKDAFLSLSPGDETEIDQVLAQLQRLGYEPAEPVRVPGQFSKRGGILDVFPTGHDLPMRIEFFGDEVESIRRFDPMNQRSLGPAKSLEIVPSRETLLPGGEEGMTDMLERMLSIEAAVLPEAASHELHEKIEGDIQALENRVFFNRLDLYRPLLHPDSGCAVDLLGDNGLLILDEPTELDAHASRSIEELGAALKARESRGEILSSESHDFMQPPDRFGHQPQTLAFTLLDGEPLWLHTSTIIEANARALHSYQGQPQVLAESLTKWVDRDMSVVVATDQPSRAKAMLAQVELFPDFDEKPEPEPGLHMAHGNLAGGFLLEDQKIALITDHELFGVMRLKLPQRKFNQGTPISSVLDLKPGDFVVHINFGIGVYRGLVKRDTDGIEKEYLHLEYKKPDQLYVPADQLDRIQKHLSPEDAPPKLHRLAGGEWSKTVSKAREDAREFAKQLINLYAQRRDSKRPTFGQDSPWQAEMEATFPWIETPSQETAIDDVKSDMETDFPMDRLVCGDVGFGKTEVAIRAAFKAAQAGRQVAVLCPTTILSEQHFRSFSERLAAFPTKLGLLNRFVKPKERKRVLRGLEDGSIDMVIGTHALLSKDLKFKELGLLIIDEEQKFGVKHKESLKSLRLSVDVLSLSATPIPRTLSMAMMNIRQMSVITDPPPGRLPVRTFVKPYGREVVAEAIHRELARGGQIYYVAPKIVGIHQIADDLQKMLPTAKIAIGHGQMAEGELEPVMIGFIRGEIDILVSTTIVENGLDISNANTLIVQDSDRFGLSQLYQLRGRVGRSDRQAYALFLYNDPKTLTDTARNRLTALSEFSQLGSGYSVAVRDLQIRGAGDLLGKKQSGQMTAVGYELYSQLIEAEADFLRAMADGSPDPVLADPLAGLDPLPSVDLPVNAFLPESYIREQGQRLFYYKKLMSCRDMQAIYDTSAELTDRYGIQPEEAAKAVSIIALRVKAQKLKLKQIQERHGNLAISFHDPEQLLPRVQAILQRARAGVHVSRGDVIWPVGRDPIDSCETFLEIYEQAMVEVEEDRRTLGLN